MNRDSAAERGRTLAHAEESEACPLGRGQTHAESVVAHVEHHGRASDAQADLHMRGLGVPGDVGQRFLHHAEERRRALGIQPRGSAAAGQPARDART